MRRRAPKAAKASFVYRRNSADTLRAASASESLEKSDPEKEAVEGHGDMHRVRRALTAWLVPAGQGGAPLLASCSIGVGRTGMGTHRHNTQGQADDIDDLGASSDASNSDARTHASAMVSGAIARHDLQLVVLLHLLLVLSLSLSLPRLQAVPLVITRRRVDLKGRRPRGRPGNLPIREAHRQPSHAGALSALAHAGARKYAPANDCASRLRTRSACRVHACASEHAAFASAPPTDHASALNSWLAQATTSPTPIRKPVKCRRT